MQRRQHGFTLVEVCITVAILALAAAVIIPGMNNVSRAELRKGARGMGTAVRSAYDHAALSGQTYRMVIKPGNGNIDLEASEETLNYDEQSGAFVAAARGAEELNALREHPGGTGKESAHGAGKKSDDSKAQSGALSALLGINKLGQKAAQAGFKKIGGFDLGGSVRVLDLWTSGMDQPATEGEVYLYFFPNGYTQDALIHLEDSDKRVFTVKVAPLTGKSEFFDHYVEVPQ